MQLDIVRTYVCMVENFNHWLTCKTPFSESAASLCIHVCVVRVCVVHVCACMCTRGLEHIIWVYAAFVS